MPVPLGCFSDPDSLVALLRQRQHALGLSNAALEALCSWADGVADKYLGPSRTKVFSATSLAVVMAALGLTAQLVVDEAGAAKMQRLWAMAGRRQERSVRPAARIAKAAVARVRPVVLAELAAKGGKARWEGSTPQARAAHIAKMNTARLAGMTK